jgi:Cys-tRNA(Pro)/Cys-tRNA(Cys) deacylase
MRILEGMQIPFQVREYEVDEEHLDAVTVAGKVGLPPEQVFKTLLVRGDRNGCAFVVIPGNMELDFKALAKCTGDRKVEMVPLKEVTPLTGYIRGGVTVLGAKKEFPVFVDFTIDLWDVVLAPADYVKAVGAQTGEIARFAPA